MAGVSLPIHLSVQQEATIDGQTDGQNYQILQRDGYGASNELMMPRQLSGNPSVAGKDFAIVPMGGGP